MLLFHNNPDIILSLSFSYVLTGYRRVEKKKGMEIEIKKGGDVEVIHSIRAVRQTMNYLMRCVVVSGLFFVAKKNFIRNLNESFNTCNIFKNLRQICLRSDCKLTLLNSLLLLIIRSSKGLEYLQKIKGEKDLFLKCNTF